MLDRKLILENPERVQESLNRRRSDLDISPLLSLSERRREILKRAEQLKADRNRQSQEIGKLRALKQDTTEAQEGVRRMGDEIKGLDAELATVEAQLDELLMVIPNVLQADVPSGADSDENVQQHVWGVLPSFAFPPKPHWEVGEKLGILDFERAGKIAGARFSVLKGAGAALERALISFMLDLHTGEHGYLEILPPYMVNRKSMTGTGQLPKFEQDLFKLTGEKELFLIPTAEVPVTNLHADEELKEEQLPISYTAFTPCFRAEAGSYGKDVRGLIRQHQFHKVELVKFTHPERSAEEHEKLTRHAETVLEKLELPYRRMLLCSGDTGFASSRTYDLEVWLPGQGTYREISSCSNFGDFQARRANIRFRPAGGGKLQYVHTLNGSGLAVGRTLLAILENYQAEDGSVRVPGVLQKYMGRERINIA
ncbi:MAG: serine--tRNA ligase [Myxococcota bacterium]